MRPVWALLLTVSGAILLVLGLGIVLFLPEGRDVRNRSIVIGVALLVSGATALVAAVLVRNPRSTAPVEKEPPAPTSSPNILKYLIYAAIPGAICTGSRVLVQAEMFKLSDGIGSMVAVLFGGPFFIAGQKILDVGLGPMVTTGGVSLVYFWLLFIPLGKLAGLLPAKSPRAKLLTTQYVIGTLHLLWGITFALLMRA